MSGINLYFFAEDPSLDPDTLCLDGRFNHHTQLSSRLDYVRHVPLYIHPSVPWAVAHAIWVAAHAVWAVARAIWAIARAIWAVACAMCYVSSMVIVMILHMVYAYAMSQCRLISFSPFYFILIPTISDNRFALKDGQLWLGYQQGLMVRPHTYILDIPNYLTLYSIGLEQSRWQACLSIRQRSMLQMVCQGIYIYSISKEQCHQVIHDHYQCGTQ